MPEAEQEAHIQSQVLVRRRTLGVRMRGGQHGRAHGGKTERGRLGGDRMVKRLGANVDTWDEKTQ